MAWCLRSLLVAALALAGAGCFLLPSAPRPDPKAISGPVPYVEDCVACHATPTAAHYLESRHAAEGIRCGQCHAPGGHPDFARPVEDGTCGGCHQSEYQQTVASKHFAERLQRPLNGDRVARVQLRQDGFTAPRATGRGFVGDASSGAMGGRLCAACHYDEHRLGLGRVQQPNFCIGCHGDRAQHFAEPTADANRCVTCHARVGVTVAGQVVNTHRFAIPGTEGTGR